MPTFDAQFLWSFCVASVCGVACALLGVFLVLKRLSMLGDAISHGIVPGVALAVLFTGQVTSVWILLGAMVFGVVTALLIQSLHLVGKVSEDSSQGVVSSALFATGILIVSKYLRNAHVDLDCVFFGLLEGAYLKTDIWFGLDVPDVLPTMLLALGLTVGFIVLFWKELKLASFDPGLADAMGYSAHAMHYLLIGLVAGVTVVSFEAFGSVLVVALLIVPAMTAQLLTDRLWVMMVLSALFAVLASFLGTWAGSPEVFDSNLGGTIALCAGAMFLATVLAAPRYGILAGVMRRLKFSLRVAGEDLLALLYRARESGKPPTNLWASEHGFSPWLVRCAFWRLKRLGLIAVGPTLTPRGLIQAETIVRAHRLWETFLDHNFQLPRDHLHDPASRMEHYLGPELQDRLAQELDLPDTDPHGKAIPKS